MYPGEPILRSPCGYVFVGCAGKEVGGKIARRSTIEREVHGLIFQHPSVEDPCESKTGPLLA